MSENTLHFTTLRPVLLHDQFLADLQRSTPTFAELNIFEKGVLAGEEPRMLRLKSSSSA